MMKVKLLTGGGYSFLNGATFPALVDADSARHLPGIEVHFSQMRKCGATDPVWMRDGTVYFADGEFEVIHE